MKRTFVAAALLIASTGVASAGVYGGLSVGPSSSVQDDQYDLTAPGRALRLLGGYRLGRLGVEASVTGNQLRASNGGEIDHRQIALLGKYNFPLGSNFELFGRAGLQRTWLLTALDNWDTSGNGILLGPGVEYVLKFVAATATIRLDYTISYSRPSNAMFDDEGGISFASGQWMLGFTVGI